MEEAIQLLYTSHLGVASVVGRLLLAAFLGLLIGINREYHPAPAGMRTHMLVSLGAATFAVLMEEIIHSYEDIESLRSEPVRIIEAVTAGVAFIAAGTIIQSRGRVKGLTTGAGMWVSGAVGLACGIGAYFVGIFAAVMCLLILTVIKWIEDRLPHRKRGSKGWPEEEERDREGL